MPTEYGLRVFNSSGQLRLEVTDSITRYLGKYVVPYNQDLTLNPDNWSILTEWDYQNGGVVVYSPQENSSNTGTIGLAHKLTIQNYSNTGIKRQLLFQKQPRTDWRNDTIVNLFLYS